jgi:general secretion pathway protein I
MRSPARQRGKGFTLVEVLVAVAIVAIALAAGSRAASALIDNAQRFSEVNAAQWCADNQLVNLKLGTRFPDVGESTFQCEQLGRSYHGLQHVRVSANPNFRIVEAAVADDNGRTIVSIATVISRF